MENLYNKEETKYTTYHVSSKIPSYVKQKKNLDFGAKAWNLFLNHPTSSSYQIRPC